MEHSKETWRYFIKTKFALRVDTCSSTDNPLQGSDRTVKKSSIYFKKAGNAVTHMAISDLNKILTLK